jgi:hypothetical protein
MNNAKRVSGLEGVCQLNPEVQCLSQRDCTPAAEAHLQAFPLQQLHDDDRLAVVLLNLVNRTNVGVI